MTYNKYKRHGMCNTKFYRVWSNMKTRCLNPNSPPIQLSGHEKIITIKKEIFDNFNFKIN